MRRSLPTLLTLALIGALAGCDDDPVEPTALETAWELSVDHAIVQDGEDDAVTARFHLVAADDETAAEAEDVHSIEIFWPTVNRTFDGSPAFTTPDGMLPVATVTDEGLAEAAPAGSYEVRLTFDDMRAQTFVFELTPPWLAPAEVDELVVGDDQATVSWTGPDEPHAWSMEVHGVTDAEEGEMDLLETIAGDDVLGGDDLEITVSIEDVVPGEAFRIDLLLEDEENERLIRLEGTRPGGDDADAEG